MASQTDGVAELKRQLDIADADIALVNKRLYESQGRWFLRGHLVREPKPTLLQHVCEMQIVPLLWRAFGPNLLKPRSRPEGVMRRP